MASRKPIHSTEINSANHDQAYSYQDAIDQGREEAKGGEPLTVEYWVARRAARNLAIAIVQWKDRGADLSDLQRVLEVYAYD